jgi:hypothetical protein
MNTGDVCCDECGRSIQSWIWINGRKVCDWCKPDKEARGFAQPLFPDYSLVQAQINGKLDMILKKLDSRQESGGEK